jgi:hypothetical protein
MLKSKSSLSHPEISFQTVLDAVNHQSQEIEAKVDAKIS